MWDQQTSCPAFSFLFVSAQLKPVVPVELISEDVADLQSESVFGVRSSLSKALGAVFPIRQSAGFTVCIQQLITVTQSYLKSHTETKYECWDSSTLNQARSVRNNDVLLPRPNPSLYFCLLVSLKSVLLLF